MRFPTSKAVIAASLLLILQAALMYSSVRQENIPSNRPLSEVPTKLGDWTVHREGVIEQEILDALKADDLLNRTYARPGDIHEVSFFVAFFRSQRNGKTPHSPKNCLPGNGWMPLVSEIVNIESGLGPIEINRYIISRGERRALVLYWYQSRDRVVASEYQAKLYVMTDAVRFNRTDTALVKVTLPLASKEDDAMPSAVDFVKASFATLREFLPQ